MQAKLLLTVTLLMGTTMAPAGDLDQILADISPDIAKWATVVLVDDSSGQPQFTWHHYGDSADAVNFWPASTIKIYAVVAAVEQLNELNADLDAVLVYEHQTDGQWVLDCARSAREMISEVFRRSSNEDYTLLLRFVGVDRINTQFLIPQRGFPHAALMRGYVLGRPYEYVREEPQRITVIRRDGTRETVAHTWSGTSYSEQRGATVISATTGNCTSTREMAECLRRIMFHEHLPENERYHLTAEQLEFIRAGGAGLYGLENREAGPYAWKGGADTVFPDARYYHKGGLISTYSLDLAYVDDPTTGVKYLLAIAANTGKTATVNQMAHRIALWVRDQRCRIGKDVPMPPTVAPDAQLQEIFADDRFFEGPVWDPKTGKLYFTAFGKDNQQILRLDEPGTASSPGQASVWLDHTQGVNGMSLSKEGKLLGAQVYAHRVLEMTIGEDGPTEQRTLAAGDAWNQPNDVCQSPTGHIYFSDPDFKERQTSVVFWLTPAGADGSPGKVTKVIDDMAIPNGLLTSNDGKWLYVADSWRKHWRRYPLAEDGSAGKGELFFEPTTDNQNDPDGMTIDAQGNLYFAGRGGVWVVSPTGDGLGLIAVPEFCSNVTIGGADGKTLFMTCKGKVYSLALR